MSSGGPRVGSRKRNWRAGARWPIWGSMRSIQPASCSAIPQPVSVYANISTSYKDFDVDDTGVILVNWDNGATSYIESGWWQPHADGPEAATQLYGTLGFGQLFPTRLELPDVEAHKMNIVDPGFAFPRENHAPQSLYNRQMQYFIDCIEQKLKPIPGPAEGLVNMKVVDAAYESARTGKVMEVKP